MLFEYMWVSNYFKTLSMILVTKGIPLVMQILLMIVQNPIMVYLNLATSMLGILYEVF